MAKSSRDPSSSSSSKRKRHSQDATAESSADESFVSARSSSSKDKSKSKSKSKSSKDKESPSKHKHKKSSHSNPSSSRKKKHPSRHGHDHDEDSDADTFASASDGESVTSAAGGTTIDAATTSSRPSKSDAFLTSQPRSSAFELQYPIITLSIPPIHAERPSMAIAEVFDSLVMRFVPPLHGVLVSHGEAYFLVKGQVSRDEKDVPPSAIIDSDGAFASVRAAVECCVWRPKVGMKIEGTITLSTPSHVSLLIHSTFNASIPSNHMADYEFIESEGYEHDDYHGDSGGGYWRHRKTKERLGEKTDGRLEFIVIGLTISHPSLSLTGSLLSSPFSVPPPRSMFSTLAQTSQETANSYGFGQKVTFADDAAEHDEAIQKATRRVRWQEDDDEGLTTDADTDVEGAGSGRHVKF